jgi:hypothetical protein
LRSFFYRGYCVRRLAEDWGDGPAIIGTACLFTFSHGQYLIPNLYNAGMIVGLPLFAIGAGIVFRWTGSLIPSVGGHAIINVPMTAFAQSLILASLMLVAILTSRGGWMVVKKIFAKASPVACVTLGIACGVYAIIAGRDEPPVYVASVLMVLCAVALEVVERRRSDLIVLNRPRS